MNGGKSSKKKTIDTYNNMDESQKYAKWKKVDIKKLLTYCVIPFMWNLRQNYTNRKNTNSSSMWGEGTDCNEHKGTLGGCVNVSCLDYEGYNTIACVCENSLNYILANFSVC